MWEKRAKDNTDDNNNKQEPINKAFQLSILILQGVPFLMCSIPIIQIINWFNIFSRVDPDLTFSSTKLQRNLWTVVTDFERHMHVTREYHKMTATEDK